MQRKQLVGVICALAAVLVCLVMWIAAPALFAWTLPEGDTVADRLVFLSRWLLVPGLALLIGVQAAGRRGFYADAIDGTRTPANHGLEINLRYNLNTLEQTVLAAIAWLALALTLPHSRLLLIPMMASLFAV